MRLILIPTLTNREQVLNSQELWEEQTTALPKMVQTRTLLANRTKR